MNQRKIYFASEVKDGHGKFSALLTCKEKALKNKDKAAGSERTVFTCLTLFIRKSTQNLQRKILVKSRKNWKICFYGKLSFPSKRTMSLWESTECLEENSRYLLQESMQTWLAAAKTLFYLEGNLTLILKTFGVSKGKSGPLSVRTSN